MVRSYRGARNQVGIVVDMGRKAKDPALNAMAHELLEIRFTENAELDSIANAFTPEDLRRVKISSNFKSYHVLYFIGGKYRIIGYTKNPTTACRFADMAEWRLWKYRARDPHPPADSDLHFGVEQAKADCLNETAAAALLSKIELYMREAAIIPDYKDLEARRAAKQKVKETRRTVRGDMYGLFADVMTALEGLSDQLNRIESKIHTAWKTAPYPFTELGGPELFKRNRLPIDTEGKDATKIREQIVEQRKELIDIFSESTPATNLNQTQT